MNNFYTPGRQLWLRSISLSITLITYKSCPTYRHHSVFLFTSPIFNCNTHNPSRSVIAQFPIVHIINRIYRLVLLVPSPESLSLSNRRGSPSHEALLPRWKSPALCANQRASSWRGLSDVIHHPTGYHDNTSAHDILTSNIIIRRKSIIPSDIPIQNPYLLQISSNKTSSFGITRSHKLGSFVPLPRVQLFVCFEILALILDSLASMSKQ